MIRLSNGWYVALADLALILFMVTAQAVHEGRAHPPAPANPLPAEGAPIAIYRPGSGMPDLRQWLASAGSDQRMRLTVIAHHAGPDPAAAAGAAAALARQAGPQVQARMVVEPGERDDLAAVLTYDRGEANWHGDCSAPGGKETSPCD